MAKPQRPAAAAPTPSKQSFSFSDVMTGMFGVATVVMTVACGLMFTSFSRTDALYTDVGSMKGTLGEIKANVDGLRRDVDGMKADIEAIRAAVSEIGKDSKEILKRRASLDENLIAPELSPPVANDGGKKIT